MDEILEKYEVVVGLEVHIQLLTKSKVFCADKNEYGSVPNSNVGSISLGHPGALPRMNKKVLDLGIKLGLAVDADITREMHFDRKNYFYADLPKGYQITQDSTPICRGGKITIKGADGNKRDINITRIHIEEDAGKSMHDLDIHNTLVDLNRAGVPLLEIVSEPEIRTSEEAYDYLTEVRKLVRYLEVCDGNLEEGSMRCDANISIMPIGSTTFGERVEVKNMNSIRNVQRAIDGEVKRQFEIYENGGTITMETRGYNAVSNTTASQRTKEGAPDYRYFPEPDLQPLLVSQEQIEAVRATLPPLPNELFEKYTAKLGLSEYDAGVLTGSKPIALYFEELIAHTENYKAAANWMMGAVKAYLNHEAVEIDQFPISATNLAELIGLIDEGKVNNNVAEKQLFPAMLLTPEKSVAQLAEEKELLQSDNSDVIIQAVQEAMAKFPDKVEAYRNGNKNLLGMFMGQVMKASKGKADPKKANQLVRELLEKDA